MIVFREIPIYIYMITIELGLLIIQSLEGRVSVG